MANQEPVKDVRLALAVGLLFVILIGFYTFHLPILETEATPEPEAIPKPEGKMTLDDLFLETANVGEALVQYSPREQAYYQYPQTWWESHPILFGGGGRSGMAGYSKKPESNELFYFRFTAMDAGQEYSLEFCANHVIKVYKSQGVKNIEGPLPKELKGNKLQEIRCQGVPPKFPLLAAELPKKELEHEIYIMHLPQVGELPVEAFMFEAIIIGDNRDEIMEVFDQMVGSFERRELPAPEISPGQSQI